MNKSWEALAQKELKGRDIQSLYKQLDEGFTLKPVYGPKDMPSTKALVPGETPFTRGVYATMYANKAWTLRQYAGFESAEKSNAFYKNALEKGQKGLSVAFDLATHRGYDSDHPRVTADVGNAGVAIDSVLDMKQLFEDIPLDKVSVSMTMNGAVLPVLAGYIVAAEEMGIKKENLSGTIQNDILKEFLVRNTYIYPPGPSMRIVGDIIEYASKEMPKFNTISISGYHIHEAGANLSLELALTLANGLEYVKTAMKRGLDIDAFAGRLSFFFATGMKFYLEIAKLRAARTLWAELIEPFGPKNPKSKMLRTHCQTSGWSLQAKDPYNNIVRTTIEAMASIFGGTQSLHTNSFDEALSLPSELSAKIARNTQLILAEETLIPNVADPFGGSYMMEALTDEMCQKARAILSAIQELGGMEKAVASGVVSGWIEESALKRQAEIESGQEVIVGVNKYQDEGTESVELFTVDHEAVLRDQKQKLGHLKKNRNSKKVSECLGALKNAAQGDKNLLPLCIEAMRARCSLGEVSECLARVFTRHEVPMTSLKGVFAGHYESSDSMDNVQKKTRDFEKRVGRRPRILVAKMGQDGHDRGAKIVASAFSDFGFDVDMSPLFQTPGEAVKHAIESDVHVIGISSMTGGHNTLVKELLAALKRENALDITVVLGGVVPKSDADRLLKKGVSAVFAPGSSLLEAAIKIIDGIKKAH